MKLKLIPSLFFCAAAFGQTALTQTTTTATQTVATNILVVTTTTGMVVGTNLYVVDPGRGVGEMEIIRAISSLNVTTVRNGTNKAAHVSGSVVLIGPNPSNANAALAFQAFNPSGACTAASTLFTPWVNYVTGEQWLCSTLTLSWVPGWNNDATPGVTAAVASAAGVTLPSGPFFHISGTNAITGFTLPVGFTGGCFMAVADAIWTWTAAGNILTAGTTTAAGRTHQFCYDWSAAKWVPDKVI